MPWPKEEPTGAESARRRDHQLLPEIRSAGSGDARDLRRRREAGAPLLERRPGRRCRIPRAPVPLYWYRRPQQLSTAAGMHRFMWDLHYQPLPDGRAALGAGPTGCRSRRSLQHAPAPTTPWVYPGTTVKLTVDGKSYTQPITVKQDPRVKTPAPTMTQVLADEAICFGGGRARVAAANASVRQQIAKLQPQGERGGARGLRREGGGPRSARPGSGGRGGRGGAGRRGPGLPGRGQRRESRRQRHALGREHRARERDEYPAGSRRRTHRQHAGRDRRHARQRRARPRTLVCSSRPPTCRQINAQLKTAGLTR